MTSTASRGQLAAAISNAIVGIHSQYYGKGPTKAKTYLIDDTVICVMQDVFTTVERTLIDGNPVAPERCCQQVADDGIAAQTPIRQNDHAIRQIDLIVVAEGRRPAAHGTRLGRNTSIEFRALR